MFLQFSEFGSVCLIYCRQEVFDFVGRFGSVSLQTQKESVSFFSAKTWNQVTSQIMDFAIVISSLMQFELWFRRSDHLNRAMPCKGCEVPAYCTNMCPGVHTVCLKHIYFQSHYSLTTSVHNKWK